MSQIRSREQGGVSIFIVIFTALLITIVTSSFAQLMVRNQQQASANDLAQSAYDSALAGVEDAKRALIKLQECEANGDAYCGGIKSALESQRCDSLGDAGAGVVTFTNGEVQVGDAALNQAYTCVKVELNTPDYKDDSISPGVPVVVPLKSNENFDKVRLSWFTKDDLDKSSSNTATMATFPAHVGNPFALPDAESWPNEAPALMRAQLIQFVKGNINLDDFNNKGTPHARTLFLYPQNYGGINVPQSQSFGTDTRRNTADKNEPVPASCHTTFGGFNGYACQVELTLPSLGAGEREAYLQLQPYYQQYTSYKVELLRGSTPVRLNQVQPRVDSTGRASSLFRRIEANITLRKDGINLEYPDAALTVGGDLCKNFFITNRGTDYSQNCSVDD